MEANQLSVGNYITRKSSPDSLCTVNWGIIKEIELGEASDYIPVPLSFELLENRFGLKDKKFISECGKKEIKLAKSVYDTNGGYAIFFNGNWICQIHYLHQLQNIVCLLMGQELKSA